MGKKVFGWKKTLAVFVICIQTCFMFSQSDWYSWDFSNCDIKDILYAVSLDTGISIVADDTVSGTSDFRFAGKDFEVAFDSFLKTARLYVEKTENVWTVSRCMTAKKSDGCMDFDAFDMTPALMLEKISLFVDEVVTYDTLPSAKMSVHFKNLSETELMECLARRFGSYEIVKTTNGVHFAKKMEKLKVEAGNSFVNLWVGEDGSYNVDLQDALFSEVVGQIFQRAEAVTGKKYSFCNLTNSDSKIQRAVFSGECVEDLLFKLCGQVGNSVIYSDGICYIVSDENSKDNLVFGESCWEKFFLKYTSTDVIFPIIQTQLGKVSCISVPESNCFFAKVNGTKKSQIKEIIEQVDIKNSTFVVELKYIKPEQFVQQLPPSVNKEKISVGDENSCVYFKGTQEEYENLCQQLEYFDKPVKRLSYDLLILQYDETSQNTFDFSTSADTLTMGNRNNLSVQLGSVMGLNLNVVTAFGLNFAAALQASIEENSTKVFADTTLHGVSGKSISFQNTNTYRYRDNNLDPDTGKPVYSGVTKEIVSGITLDIQGWVSGEGMITSTVKAVVSRQGTDTSSSTGNPPPTSEKVVTTEVCCKSGEPVVLSGLVQNSETVEKKGLVFKAQEKTKEKSQMVIYLVPHIEECGGLEGNSVDQCASAASAKGEKKSKYTVEYVEKTVLELLKVM